MSCDYNDAYILVRGTITVGTGGSDVGAGQTDEKNKDVRFKNYARFKDYITEINNTQVGNVKGKILVLWCQSII